MLKTQSKLPQEVQFITEIIQQELGIPPTVEKMENPTLNLFEETPNSYIYLFNNFNNLLSQSPIGGLVSFKKYGYITAVGDTNQNTNYELIHINTFSKIRTTFGKDITVNIPLDGENLDFYRLRKKIFLEIPRVINSKFGKKLKLFGYMIEMPKLGVQPPTLHYIYKYTEQENNSKSNISVYKIKVWELKKGSYMLTPNHNKQQKDIFNHGNNKRKLRQLIGHLDSEYENINILIDYQFATHLVKMLYSFVNKVVGGQQSDIIGEVERHLEKYRQKLVKIFGYDRKLEIRSNADLYILKLGELLTLPIVVGGYPQLPEKIKNIINIPKLDEIISSNLELDLDYITEYNGDTPNSKYRIFEYENSHVYQKISELVREYIKSTTYTHSIPVESIYYVSDLVSLVMYLTEVGRNHPQLQNLLTKILIALYPIYDIRRLDKQTMFIHFDVDVNENSILETDSYEYFVIDITTKTMFIHKNDNLHSYASGRFKFVISDSFIIPF